MVKLWTYSRMRNTYELGKSNLRVSTTGILVTVYTNLSFGDNMENNSWAGKDESLKQYPSSECW